MPMINHESMLENSRTERNRFVAFTFAASDLVLEVGCDGAFAYAAAVGHGLGG